MILGYTYAFIALSLGLVGWIGWRWKMDRWDGMNQWADGVEKLLPRWLSWEMWGDPATWLHHAIFTAVASHVGGALAFLTGTKIIAGAFAWAVGASVFYAAREVGDMRHHWEDQGGAGAVWRGSPHYTGWLIDGLMDLLFPALYATWLGTLLGA